MSSIDNKPNISNDEEDCLFAVRLVTGSVMHMVMQAALDLNLFQIIARAGEGAKLSPSELASLIPTQNPNAPMMLDRILRLLASYSVLSSSVMTRDNGDVERVYGLASVCKYLVPNEDGMCFSPWIHLVQHNIPMQCWSHLKDAVIEGGDPFTMTHGVHTFDYFAKDSKLNELFNKVMFNNTTIFMKKVLDKYKGFAELKEVVDIGGGIGTMSSIITSIYPTIKCTNFDLPHVIEHAPPYPRVKHVGGDMFVIIPKGESIFLKNVLHNWNDEQCLKLLKNCYDALPDNGKTIVVDAILPTVPQSDTAAKAICQLDLIMMGYSPTGRERTEQEFESLAKGAGFASIKLICSTYNHSVMEFYKTM